MGSKNEPEGSRKPIRNRRDEFIPTDNFTPRTFQVDLLDNAIHQNTIVCLGRGTGKTFIAVMLIKELAYQIRKDVQNDGKRTFFLVESVPLVAQQAKVLRLHTDVCVGEYVAAMGVDSWEKEKWSKEFQQKQVLVMTAQIFLNILHHGFFPMWKVNLIVFDECHHAVKSHPYVKIMDHFGQCDPLHYPRILGLTASILNSKCKTPDELERKMGELEVTLHSSAETSTDMISLETYGATPKETIVECDLYEDFTGLVSQFDVILNSALDFLNDSNIAFSEEENERDPCAIPRTVLVECLVSLHQLGPWCCDRLAQAFHKQLDKILAHEAMDINIQLIIYTQTQLRMIHNLFIHKYDRLQSLEELLSFVSPKVLKTLEILREYKPDDDFMIIGGGPTEYMDMDAEVASDDSFDTDEDDDYDEPFFDMSKQQQQHSQIHYIARKRSSDENVTEEKEGALCGIVFVERRHAAFALHKLIEELCNWDTELFFVRSSHITGHSAKSGGVRTKETENQFRKQEEILRSFRCQEVNLLVATSVVEEGVDVPKCNLVIRFDPPSNYRSYVQSKGRARAKESQFVMIVEHGKLTKFHEDLQTYRGIEKILLGKCNECEDQDEEEHDTATVDNLIPPYMPVKEEGAPCVTMSSAIALVNRYCAKLPSDAFTHLTPKWHIEEQGTDPVMYVCTLRLPINSPVKEPCVGDPMSSQKLAKMAVALKTCQKLHEAGELDNHLLPIGTMREMLRYDDDENEWDSEDVQGQARPGTTKRKQYYYKKIAEALSCEFPQVGQSSFMYVINMKLTCPITEDQNTRGRKIYAPEDNPRFFGILTTKLIPKIPNFPVFTRSGEVGVSLILAQTDVVLNAEQNEKLSQFHQYVFERVLRLRKDPMVYTPKQAPSGCIIIPVYKGDEENYQVDWDFINKIDMTTPLISRRSYLFKPDREKFTFEDNKFEDAVVMPAYRNIDQPQFFYVAEIRHDLNPRSSFPSPELFRTFQDYYFSKYGLKLTDMSQPLLDVDHTSARLNLLTPRYVNQKGVALPTSSAETKRARRENLQQKQILIPELCDIHPFPASFWRKAVCLPTILYRINYLLIAEEIRIRISSEAGIGIAQLPKDYIFPNLDFGFRQEMEKQCLLNGIGREDEEGESTDSFEDKSDEDECEPNKPACEVDTDSKKSAISTILPTTTETHTFNGCSDEHENKGQLDPEINHQDVLLHKRSGLTLNLSPATNPSEPNAKQVHSMPDKKPLLLESTSPFPESTEESSKTNGSLELLKNCDKNQELFRGDSIEVQSVPGGDSDPMATADCDIKDSTSAAKISFDADIELENYIGPTPSMLIQALTMSNANDFFNLERLETIGDSFLKFAVTIYLYCTYPGIHEGKLSNLRSKQVSNFNLYRLGKKKGLAECMIATKFEPNENWLPPGYVIDSEKTGGLKIQIASMCKPKTNQSTSLEESVNLTNSSSQQTSSSLGQLQQKFNQELEEINQATETDTDDPSDVCVIPYDLRTQHSLPDKSIADCVEALIGCYLTQCGPKAALQFMSWVGLKVLPEVEEKESQSHENRKSCHDSGNNGSSLNGHTAMPVPSERGKTRFHPLQSPPSPLLTHVPKALQVLEHYLSGFEQFEETIQYRFKDRAYLLQAFTHASYHYNTVTDCYQRLEFLGDAILDYLITRHLYEDDHKFSPGVLTDLRSALVNNNIFAALAVKWNFHKFFKAVCPQLFSVIDDFVEWQKEREDFINVDQEFMEIDGDNEEEGEDVEIPKALGDIFESVAGAIYMDSDMSLDSVWRVYFRMMKPQIDQFTAHIPRSPVRELLELEPETAKFEKPERTMEGKIRVTVNVVGKGSFRGLGRNYRIAKSTAARRALKYIRMIKLQETLALRKAMAPSLLFSQQ
ncbi:LOW QUALITY PROTEIN: endoribonuclease Dicer-like [Lingula anatina]|uniref:ribonuclease III n=1 Tax=Lingula anatina TaxID=7574 RepID=A0A1S3JIA9_LINAN|nr:LOW QUALITY PROTEIN: endoribonuclease Dicer-like [Lingula anatina]|eukprot:XP_013409876.1 LOW QUALITY PROTEIN: endoribonuclease Dicer-like [Lingula anatina]